MDSIQKIYNGISNCAKTNLYAIAFAVYLLIIFFYMTNEPDKLYSEQYFYFSIIIIPFAAMCFWIYKNFIDIQNIYTLKSSYPKDLKKFAKYRVFDNN